MRRRHRCLPSCACLHLHCCNHALLKLNAEERSRAKHSTAKDTAVIANHVTASISCCVVVELHLCIKHFMRVQSSFSSHVFKAAISCLSKQPSKQAANQVHYCRSQLAQPCNHSLIHSLALCDKQAVMRGSAASEGLVVGNWGKKQLLKLRCHQLLRTRRHFQEPRTHALTISLTHCLMRLQSTSVSSFYYHSDFLPFGTCAAFALFGSPQTQVSHSRSVSHSVRQRSSIGMYLCMYVYPRTHSLKSISTRVGGRSPPFIYLFIYLLWIYLFVHHLQGSEAASVVAFSGIDLRVYVFCCTGV